MNATEEWLKLNGEYPVRAKQAKTRDGEKVARKLAQALDKLSAKESDMVRAQNAWLKVRRTVKYLEKELDKLSKLAE